MKTIAIIAFVATAATIYMMTSFGTSALECQFSSFMIEYKKSYNSEAEYKFTIRVFIMNLWSSNIPWSIPNFVAVFCLQLTKFPKLM